MKVCLVNPCWSLEGGRGSAEHAPLLPLELGYCAALLERAGHEAVILDAPLEGLTTGMVARRVAAFAPDMTVVTSAPTYLAWRCPAPALDVPRETFAAIRSAGPQAGGLLVAVGPHGTVTPRAVLQGLKCDVVVMGECEEVVARLADGEALAHVSSIAWRDGSARVRVQGRAHVGRFSDLPALLWPEDWIARRRGGEVEASRGCAFHCSFCAKRGGRDGYRRRNLGDLLLEIDGLRGQGARHLFFIDEVFLPDRRLLEALAGRDMTFGIHTRIDLWEPEMLDLLGWAGCVSLETGIESLTAEGRDMLGRDCRLDTEALTHRLIHARRRVPRVVATLLAVATDDAAHVARWREAMRALDIVAPAPVPVFPYPGTADYARLFGPPDDLAWERAQTHYAQSHWAGIAAPPVTPPGAVRRRPA